MAARTSSPSARFAWLSFPTPQRGDFVSTRTHNTSRRLPLHTLRNRIRLPTPHEGAACRTDNIDTCLSTRFATITYTSTWGLRVSHHDTASPRFVELSYTSTWGLRIHSHQQPSRHLPLHTLRNRIRLPTPQRGGCVSTRTDNMTSLRHLRLHTLRNRMRLRAPHVGLRSTRTNNTSRHLPLHTLRNRIRLRTPQRGDCVFTRTDNHHDTCLSTHFATGYACLHLTRGLHVYSHRQPS